jgi:hypothetical protein
MILPTRRRRSRSCPALGVEAHRVVDAMYRSAARERSATGSREAAGTTTSSADSAGFGAINPRADQ